MMYHELSSEQSDYPPDECPKSYSCNPRKWYHITERERGEYAGLVRARNGDLSIHLYNAHKLHQRAREFENDPLNSKVNVEYPNIPNNHRTYKPPDRWTAWPLTPDDVPRAAENCFNHDGLDEYTIKKLGVEWPSQELEEIIHSITLKLARKNFEVRHCEDYKLPTSDKGSLESGADGEVEKGIEGNKLVESFESDTHESSSKNRGVYLESVFSTDDERSRQLLRPSIRHIITKIDQVLTGLHETRKVCYGHSYIENSFNEINTSTNSLVNRSNRRNRKLAISKEKIRIPLDLPMQNELLDAKKSRRGRPCKVYERLEGETHQEFLIRIARMKKKAIPISHSIDQSEKPAKVKPKSPTRSFKSCARDRFINRQRKLGLRDWSELLSTAALIGFPRNVILRTTQRCVNLFDESILMNTMTEAHYKNKTADSMECYRPSQYLCQPFLNTVSIISDSKSHRSLPRTQDLSHTALSKRKILTGQVYFCPMTHCPRILQGFKDQDALLRHLDLSHGIERALARDKIVLNYEDFDGAIHIDGFLRSAGLQHERNKKTNKI